MKQMLFLQTSEQDGPAEGAGARIGRLAVNAVQMLAAAEVLLWALFAMLGDEFPEWQLPSGGMWMIRCFLVGTVVLFGVVAPLTGYRSLAYVGFELGYIVLGGRYVVAHMEQLRGGLLAMYAGYLKEWNLYYKTNLYVRGADEAQISPALLFAVVLLLILFLLLHYVTGHRWPLLLLPSVVLLPGFLVDRLPGWQGLAFFFAGTVMLYAGTERPAKYRVLPARARDAEGIVRARLGVMVFAAAAAVSALVLAQRGFGGMTERIPEKMEEFLAIQQTLENRIANLGESLFPSDKEYVDNATPKFRDQSILEIVVDWMPSTNLYLAEFHSGDYQDGIWKQSSRAYRQAAEDAGVKLDRFGLNLWQAAYEEGTKKSDDKLVDLKGAWDYRIEYQMSTNRALVPYFSNVGGTNGKAWVEEEGLVRKKRSTKSLKFVGPGANTNVVERENLIYLARDSAGYNVRLAESTLTESQWRELGGNEGLIVAQEGERQDRFRDELDWYSGLVREYYVRESGIGAVQEAAALLREEMEFQGRFSVSTDFLAWNFHKEYGDSTDAKKVNTYRVMLADAVRKYLDEIADYNLYLDRIPSGTDTVQYFLKSGHEGYCMHFASAGTLILQELGVPARYVGGYIVKRGSFRRTPENRSYSSTVCDRNSHAWVEIYLEDVGWVPVEMTPGYELMEDTLPTDEGNRSTLQRQHANKKSVKLESEDSETESESETETEIKTESGTGAEGETEAGSEEDIGQQDEPGNSVEPEDGNAPGGGHGPGGGGGSPSGDGRGWKLLLLAAGALVLLVLGWAAICVGRRHYHELLRQEIRRKQNRRVVRRINHRIYRRLPKGVLQRGMTDAEYESRLVRAYPDVSSEAWKLYMQIVKKVAFSREPVSDEEMEHCLRCYRKR